MSPVHVHLEECFIATTYLYQKGNLKLYYSLKIVVQGAALQNRVIHEWLHLLHHHLWLVVARIASPPMLMLRHRELLVITGPIYWWLPSNDPGMHIFLTVKQQKKCQAAAWCCIFTYWLCMKAEWHFIRWIRGGKQLTSLFPDGSFPRRCFPL